MLGASEPCGGVKGASDGSGFGTGDAEAEEFHGLQDYKVEEVMRDA